MSYEQKELSGSLFKNERKTEPTHADLQGSAKIAGVEYWISGWSKKTKNGEKWLSLSFKPKSQGAAQPYKPKHEPPLVEEVDDPLQL